MVLSIVLPASVKTSSHLASTLSELGLVTHQSRVLLPLAEIVYLSPALLFIEWFDVLLFSL